MRKCLLFVFLLCLHNMARGQTTFDYEYWFDNDRSTLHTGTSSTGAWQIEADLDGLTCSFHTIHLQVRNSEGVYSSPVSRQFVKLAPSTNTLTGHYWFDNDPTTMKTSDVLKGSFVVDMSTLREGFHTFHYQATDDQGSASSVVSAIVYKTMPNSEVGTFHCWFDNDETTQQGNLPVSDVAMLDVSQLTDGFHIVHVQADGITPTVARSYYFIKQPQTKGVEYITLVCTIDDVLYKQEKVANTGGVLLWNFDTSSLKQGLHRIQVLGVTPSGAATSAYSTFFLRSATDEEIGDMKLYYYVDNDNFNLNEGTYANGGFHFDVDVSQFTDGLHRLAYFMSNGKGITTKVSSKFFWKTPIGGNGITEYWYWMNEQGDNQATKVVLPERTNPLSLITLLPVESRPIRSSLFEFKIKDDQPTIYAKNDIHIRFYDATGKFTDVSKQFVDEGVKQEVEPIGELQATQTFPKVAENDIRWYTMQVAPGDTAAFKLSQPATVQVFAPSGKEVFKTSESASLQWSGIHTWEDGTYYVAVHDVTGSRSTMTFDYMHMDKYDVVDWDVHTVGNGGCSTITFKGNGFRDLYRVDLYTADGDSIHSVDISHESDAETAVTFDFCGAEMRKYDAVFHFTEENKHIANVVTVEGPVNIELATTVSFPSAFPHGLSTTYTVKITNKGNMTAYSVPIYTWIMNKLNKDGIYHIEYDGLDLPGVFDGVDMDSLSVSERAELQALSDEIGDGHYFMLFRTIDEDSPNDSIWVRSNYFFTNIAPHETKTLRLTLSANEGVWAYFTVPEDWPSYGNEQDLSSVRRASKYKSPSLKDKYCCIKEKRECVLTLASDATGLLSALIGFIDMCIPPVALEAKGISKSANLAASILDCATSGLNTTTKILDEIVCQGDSGTGLGDLLNRLRENAGGSIIGSILSCASAKFNVLGYKKYLKSYSNLYGALSNGFSGLSLSMINPNLSCLSDLMKPTPGCPPPPPDGGGSDGGGSWDPNDIYGYLAKSGSKFMTDSVKTINYTIEFENDTTFATASAYKVVVCDTLDSRYFDLTSYAPTSVRIGDKYANLDGSQSFIKTVDMRPEIDAIAQVEENYDDKNGIMTWTLTSLNPMTMEPATDIMQGFLPVNYDGHGIGEVSYDIKLKDGLAHGDEIKNRAGIVFDANETIMTPYWTNVIDRIAPESYVADVQMATDTTAAVRIAATDELSGPWRYNVYVQYGDGAWFLGAENVPIDKVANVKVYEGIDHGFYTIVTDSAGNVEQKEAAREFTLEVFGSQIDTNTTLQLAEGWNWTSHNQQEVLALDNLKAKATRIVGQTEELYKDSRFGWMGDLDELLPTQMYKVQMAETDEVQLSGKLFNAGFRSIPLHMGWNWIGYPVANVMSPTEALAKMDAEEGEVIIGQDGMSTFSDGHWTGTLEELHPGQGYMFLSLTDKNLFFNATAQASSRRANLQYTNSKRQLPEGWAVDKRKYPNVMGVVAQLCQNGSTVESDDWLVGAFCGNECRGVAQQVDDMLMMNVYGKGSEQIVFRIIHRESGEVVGISDNEDFGSTLLGTMHQPYILNIGQLTGIKDIERSALNNDNAVYDLQGRKVDAEQTAKGVYIVTDGSKSETQKVVRK